MAGLQLLLMDKEMTSGGASGSSGAPLEAVTEDATAEKVNGSTESNSLDVLAQELALLNFSSSPYVRVESANAEKRSLRVSASFPGRHQTITRIYLVFNFPVNYPERGSSPAFVVGKGTSLGRGHR